MTPGVGLSLAKQATAPILFVMKDLYLHRKDCSALTAMLTDTIVSALAATGECASKPRQEYASRVVALMPTVRADLIAQRGFAKSRWTRPLRKVAGRMPPIYPFDQTQAGLENELHLVVAEAIVRLEATPSHLGEVQTSEPGLDPPTEPPSESLIPTDLIPNCGCNQIHHPIDVVKRLMNCFLAVLNKNLGTPVTGARFAKLTKRILDSLSEADQSETEIEARQELPLPTSLIAVVCGGGTFGGLDAVGALAAPEAAAVAIGAAAFIGLVSALTNQRRMRGQRQQLKMQQNADDLRKWIVGTAICLAQLHPSKTTALLRDEVQRLVDSSANQGATLPVRANAQLPEQSAQEAANNTASRESARHTLRSLKGMLTERILPRIDERDIYSHAVLENVASELDFLVADIPGATGDELAIKLLCLMRGKNVAQLELDS